MKLGTHNQHTLTSRYEEALAIWHAWADRRRVTGGNEAAATKMQMDDAWAHVETCRADLETYRHAMRPTKKIRQ